MKRQVYRWALVVMLLMALQPAETLAARKLFSCSMLTEKTQQENFSLAASLNTTPTATPGGDYQMNYTVRFDTAHKYLDVSLQYVAEKRLSYSDTLTLKLPMWAPGYYMIVDYPKYVIDFHVQGNGQEAARYRKTDVNAWSVVADGSDTLDISYRVYANKRSVVECRLEDDCAFIAPNGVFMYRQGDIQHPSTIRIDLPSNWHKVSTALKHAGQVYRANNFDELYDSPIFCGNPYTERFSHEGHNYEWCIETPEGFTESPIRDDFKKVVSATTQLMGDVPYEDYTLIHMGQGGGGLEHCASQACYSEGTWRFPDRAEYINYLGFVTHEYFHLYNVKRIRPIELGPFDYDHARMTPLLWVSEGFTVYYETQLMLRAGIISPEELLKELSGYIENIQTNEGQQHMSLRESSTDIWVNFFYQEDNRRETKISYYIKGPVVGLLIDAVIRDHTDGRASLDDLMRLLYNRYYRQLGRGFTELEFWQAFIEVASTGVEGMSGRELADQVSEWVDTTCELPYDEVLSRIGLQLDHQTWQLSPQKKPTKQAAKLRKALLGI